MQQHLDLIPHQVGSDLVCQRPADGYINATAMCRAHGKLVADFMRLNTTAAFLKALSADMGIPITELVQSLRGGEPELQGTWVHPDVAVSLGQWCSPEFAVQVSRWVREWGNRRASTRPAVPYHLRRYATNHPNVPPGHFSVLVEMTQLLIAPMELMGYTLPERLLPDISQGRLFCRWLRDEWGINTDALPTYRHDFEDGRVVYPKAYPDDLLRAFRNHFWTEWLPYRSIAYFTGRDAAALTYLPRILARATAAGLPAPLRKLPAKPLPKKLRHG